MRSKEIYKLSVIEIFINCVMTNKVFKCISIYLLVCDRLSKNYLFYITM